MSIGCLNQLILNNNVIPDRELSAQKDPLPFYLHLKKNNKGCFAAFLH